MIKSIKDTGYVWYFKANCSVMVQYTIPGTWPKLNFVIPWTACDLTSRLYMYLFYLQLNHLLSV